MLMPVLVTLQHGMPVMEIVAHMLLLTRIINIVRMIVIPVISAHTWCAKNVGLASAINQVLNN